MTKRKYNIDDNYFNEIDTERKAYILGLMYADGCVYPNSAKLDLKTEDIKLLEDIALEMKNNCPIKTYKYKKKSYFKYQDKTYEFDCSMSRLSMHSKQIVQDLHKHGCVSSKTLILKFPNNKIVDKSLIKHFIRGYLDGDGSISYSERSSSSKYRSSYLHFNITFTVTYDVIYGIKSVLYNIVPFDGDIRSRWKDSNNNCTLSIDGNNICFKILNWLYKDATIYLERKYNKYLMLVQEIDDKKKSVFNGMKSRKSSSRKTFNIYKNGEYMGTCNNLRKLQRESPYVFGELLHRITVSNCLKTDESYHGYNFIFIEQDNNIIDYKYVCSGKTKISKNCNILQFDLYHNFIKRWNSVKEITDELGFPASDIRSCCNGEQNTSNGYIWEYAS